MGPQEHSELDMFSFFEKTPDLVCIAGKDGYFRKINQSVIQKLGYTEAELFASPISTFIFPEDKVLTAIQRRKLLDGKPLVNFQNRYVKSNNEIIWLDWTSIYFPDKEIVFAIAKDVTERKLAEREVEVEYNKFKGLASHFKKSVEKDRKYFAEELHEEVAQLAAVVKMDIDWIRYNMGDLSEFLKTRVEHALEVSSLLINTIKRISFSVSPEILTEVGLNETLKWLCKEFTILHKIPCEFTGAYNEKDLSEEVQIDFFRVCQEALSNVANHAKAASVNIEIKAVGKKVQLSIKDDGIGFNVEKQERKFGFVNMRERAASINGHLKVTSSKKKGTAVTLTVARS
jgi:PAS domain S-box-containing protein